MMPFIDTATSRIIVRNWCGTAEITVDQRPDRSTSTLRGMAGVTTIECLSRAEAMILLSLLQEVAYGLPVVNDQP